MNFINLLKLDLLYCSMGFLFQQSKVMGFASFKKYLQERHFWNELQHGLHETAAIMQ